MCGRTHPSLRRRTRRITAWTVKTSSSQRRQERIRYIWSTLTTTTTTHTNVTEGSDKPYKYPSAFEKADVLLLHKYDLVDLVDFDEGFFTNGVRKLNPYAPIVKVSGKNGNGFEEVVAWLCEKAKKYRQNIKGFRDNLLNSCYILLGDTGFEPVTSSALRRKQNTLMVLTKRSLETVLKATGFENLRFHDLRHSYEKHGQTGFDNSNVQRVNQSALFKP